MDTEETQICFFKFYQSVLESTGILHLRSFGEMVKESVLSFRSNDAKKVVSCKESDQNAYFLEYGVLHSMISGLCFQDLMYQNLLKPTTKRHLKVCVIGGGPGFELASLCKLVENLPKPGGSDPIELHVTIIEPNWEWKEFETNVLNSLKHHKEELFDSKEVDLKFQFMCYNFKEPLDLYVQKAIRRCQILTVVNRPMVKTFDSVVFESTIFKDLLGVMKQGSFLCVIDYTEGPVYECVSKSATECNFHSYALPSLDTEYTVNLKELNLQALSYGKFWDDVLKSQTVQVISGAWRKGF